MVETTIISHLTGQMTPELMSQIQSPEVVSLVIAFGIILLAILVVYYLFSWLARSLFPKSLEYRKLLVDMYIIGMVKKFAKEDSIDLIKELKEFTKIERKKGLKEKDIDSVIDDNLKEKINAKAEKDTEKIEGN